MEETEVEQHLGPRSSIFKRHCGLPPISDSQRRLRKGQLFLALSEKFCAGCRKMVVSPLTARAVVSSCPLQMLELQLRLPPLHLLRLGQLLTPGAVVAVWLYARKPADAGQLRLACAVTMAGQVLYTLVSCQRRSHH